MSEITAATISWINISFKSPRVYRLPSEGAFSIATSSDNYENGPDVVISSSTWLGEHATDLATSFYAAVDLTREANGRFKVTVNASSQNFIFDVRDSGPAKQRSARQCDSTSLELDDGSVFDLGINSHLWTSLGDTGLGTFQIRYELDNQPPTQEVPSGSEMRARLEKMPSEVLLKIFEYLPLEDVVLNLPCVCQKFFEVVKEKVKRKHLNVYIASNLAYERKPYFFPCEMGLIAKLVLGNAVEAMEIAVKKHVDKVHFPSHLRSFIGMNCVFVSIRYYAGVEVDNSLEKNECFDQVLREISAFSKVDTLVYIWPFFSSNGLNSGSDWPLVPSVKNLSVQFDSEREVVKAQHVLEKFPNLERICYDDYKPRGTPGLFSEFGNQGPGIPWKALAVKKYPDAVAWNRFTELDTLALTPSDNFDSEQFFAHCGLDFIRIPHLKHLFLRLHQHFSEAQVLTLAGQLPVNLEVLMIDCGDFRCDETRIEIIQRLASRCPKLVTLHLNYFANINSFDMMRIYEQFPNLTRLFVNDPDDPQSMCSIEWIEQSVPGSLCFTRGPVFDDLNELFFW